MSTPLWVRELAGGFWSRAGASELFPRSLRPWVQLALDVTVVEMECPNLAGAVAWVREQGVDWPEDGPNCWVRGCLLASGGRGFVFLDCGEEERERTWTLAHEVAYFLRAYLQPREQAVRACGERILEVLDGLRPADPDERVLGVLRGVGIGHHVHLMDRGPGAGSDELAEGEAELLARELLAPADRVLARGPPEVRQLTAHLVTEYGLPPGPAKHYARDLLPPPPRRDPMLRRLFGE